MTWCLGGVGGGGTNELEAEFEWHVECCYELLYLISISDVHVFDVVPTTAAAS